MIYRCYNTCPHFAPPCEFAENFIMQIREEWNEFFCLIVGSRTFSDYTLLSEGMMSKRRKIL